MMERVVIDTSVWVAAFKSADGSSREMIRLCLRRQCRPLFGQALFGEYEDVMSREGTFVVSPLSAAEREELLDAFLSVAEWIPVFFLWRPNLSDEGDNHLIELAVAGAATALVTHNLRDLQYGELKFPLLKIVTPAEFLKRWREQHGNHDHPHS
jgi:putative PIN family toxin of toxin-antitoxin system